MRWIEAGLVGIVLLTAAWLAPAADARFIGRSLRNSNNAFGRLLAGLASGIRVCELRPAPCTWFTPGRINRAGFGFGQSGFEVLARYDFRPRLAQAGLLPQTRLDAHDPRPAQLRALNSAAREAQLQDAG